MAKTIAQLRAEAQTIKNETTIGANTATRVGGFGEDIVDYLADNPSSGGTFATGEEVGDVSVFDEISDLDGKTDEQKELMLPNGKAVEGVLGMLPEFKNYGTYGTAGTGSTDKNLSYTNWTPLDVDVKLEKVTVQGGLSALTASELPKTTTAYIGIVKDNNGSMKFSQKVAVSLTLTVAGKNVCDISSYNIIVPAGCYVMIGNKQVGTSASSRLTGWTANNNRPTQYSIAYGYGNDSSLHTDRALTAVKGDSNYSFEYSTAKSIGEKIEEMDEEISAINAKTDDRVSDISTMTSLLLFGSSLTACGYAPKGKAWIEKIHDIVDINIVNAGFFGDTLANNLTKYLNTSGFYNYVMVGSTGNYSTFNASNEEIMLRFKKAIEASSGKMLLQVEDRGLAAAAMNFMAFGRAYGIPCSVITMLAAKLWDLSQQPSGLQTNSHAGYRAMSVYAAHLDLLDKIPIWKNVKMYHVRSTYMGGNPEVNDLVYEDKFDRVKIYECVSPNRQTGNNSSLNPYIATNNADSIDSATYAVANGEAASTFVQNETGKFKAGTALTFSNFALVEFILERINITNAKFSIVSSASPTAVYVATKAHSTETTTWTSLNFTYVAATSMLTANISRNAADIQTYDKVRILLVLNGTANLSKPSLSGYNGRQKEFSPAIPYEPRVFGTELMSQTSVESGWTLSAGASVKSLPTALQGIYTRYNNVKSHVELASTDAYMQKSFTITQPTNKIAVRIVAMLMPKVANTRYTAGDYVDTENATIKLGDYDFATMVVCVNGSAIKRERVWAGWTETYMEVDIPNTVTSCDVRITFKNDADSGYNVVSDSWPLLVHDVSIQKIG